ncbi:hypothetical protein U9M48_006748 [Paspalum notatum var. saurae]|uniref:Uncharacterized protein n=1 Tax=Paspalum notatum var. saurae TaxID=547442 RepID=A0AAQ3SMC4_PASNO
MSRCLPYPPPGYVRIPVAVAVAVAEAEPAAKLQKEREKAEKKKEKRNDKKATQHGETSKHSKHSHSHKKRKHGDGSASGQETKKETKKDSQESVEQLEKSGLSEEHGAPCFMQTIHHSPESSQDSSKRRRVLPSPSQTKNGNILRIKIKSNPDSPAAVLEKPRVTDQPVVAQMGSSSFLSGKHNSVQKHNKVNARSSSAPQQRIQERLSTETTGKIIQRVAPQPPVKARQPIDAQLSVQAPVGRSDLPPKFLGNVNPSPARVMGRFDPSPAMTMQKVEPVKVLQKVEPQLTSEEIQRKSPEVCMKVAHQGTRSPVVRLTDTPQHLLQKPNDLLLPKQQQPIAPVPKEEPCSSGRDVKAVPAQEVKLSRSERKKIRKAEKKEKKIRDLFVTWNPASTEMIGSDLGEQDWLLGGTRNSDASMNNCRASGFVPIPSMEQQTSLQPRAILLPDLNIFQMPYVIPF